jgi:iron(III) transport system substrate-binding protein
MSVTRSLAMKKLSAILATACLALLVASPAASQAGEELMGYAPRGAVPPGYPASYAVTVRAGEDEGRLVIYAATDADVAAPLIADFRKMYPRIDVTYEDLNSTELYHRFIAETKLGADTADILWSSAMDQQAALVSAGYAMTYVSPEKARFPAWANWKDQGFATTYEPIVFAYNKKLLPANEVPQTHADFIRLLNADPARFKGKVSSYNIEKSGLGFFLATQDVAISSEFWTLAAALGKVQARLDLTTSAMTRRLSSGETVLGYNLLGAYTAQKAASDDALGYVFPRDYTLVMSRILIASKQAGHPNAAKLWVDYLLSQRGQSVLANASRLHAIRDDVEGENTAARLKQTLGASERPIAVGPALIGYLNNQNYRDFILQWKKALSGS